MERELNKAFAGFRHPFNNSGNNTDNDHNNNNNNATDDPIKGIATGSWGCGAFGMFCGVCIKIDVYYYWSTKSQHAQTTETEVPQNIVFLF